MSEVKINIWGRDFYLPVCLDCYPGEEELDSQGIALDAFLKSEEVIESAKPEVEDFLIQNNPSTFSEKKVDNIFRYVMPESIFVSHDEKHPTVSILCDYRFDVEHGLAVIFVDGKFKGIGAQDEVL